MIVKVGLTVAFLWKTKKFNKGEKKKKRFLDLNAHVVKRQDQECQFKYCKQSWVQCQQQHPLASGNLQGMADKAVLNNLQKKNSLLALKNEKKRKKISSMTWYGNWDNSVQQDLGNQTTLSYCRQNWLHSLPIQANLDTASTCRIESGTTKRWNKGSCFGCVKWRGKGGGGGKYTKKQKCGEF